MDPERSTIARSRDAVVLWFGVAGAYNLIAAFTDLSEWYWVTIRALVSLVFAVALVKWVVALRRDRRRL